MKEEHKAAARKAARGGYISPFGRIDKCAQCGADLKDTDEGGYMIVAGMRHCANCTFEFLGFGKEDK